MAKTPNVTKDIPQIRPRFKTRVVTFEIPEAIDADVTTVVDEPGIGTRTSAIQLLLAEAVYARRGVFDKAKTNP